METFFQRRCAYGKFECGRLNGLGQLPAIPGSKCGINAHEKEYAEAMSQQQERQMGKSQVRAVEFECENFHRDTPVKKYASAILEQREKPFNQDRHV